MKTEELERLLDQDPILGGWEVAGEVGTAIHVIYCVDRGCGGPDAEPPAYNLVCTIADDKGTEASLNLARLIVALRNETPRILHQLQEQLDKQMRL